MGIVPPFARPVSQNRVPKLNVAYGPGSTAYIEQPSQFVGNPIVPYSANQMQQTVYTAAGTATYADQLAICDATTASFVLTLPQASSCYGRRIIASKMDSTVNTITFAVDTPSALWYYATWTGLTKQYETVTWLACMDASGNYGWLALLDKAVV